MIRLVVYDMRILIIADPYVPVPPKHYGGAERVVALYAQEFARVGHRVDLVAGAGSRSIAGQLHLHRAPSKSYLNRGYTKARFQLQSLLAARTCDVVYNHGRTDYLRALLGVRKPLLNLFHCPVSQLQIDSFEGMVRSDAAFQFISHSQKMHAKVGIPHRVVSNPIDAHKYVLGGGQGGYLVFLGRLAYNKGVDVAIDVARITGRKLVIAGNISTERGGEQYFRERVQPHLDGERIRWIGPVDDAQKRQLLGDAEALLFPIRADEAFGLVIVEALACGTPVIATRRNSTPEIIDHGVTGLLCDPEEPSVDAFVEAVNHIGGLDRHACRRAAEERFDVRVVAPRVLDMLSKLANREAFT